MDIVKHSTKDYTVSESLKSTLSTHVTDQDSAVMDGTVRLEEITTSLPSSAKAKIVGDVDGEEIVIPNSEDSIILTVNGEEASKKYLLYTAAEKNTTLF